MGDKVKQQEKHVGLKQNARNTERKMNDGRIRKWNRTVPQGFLIRERPHSSQSHLEKLFSMSKCLRQE